MTIGLLLWIGFGLLVVILLTLDLGIFHRKAHVVSLREAAIWSAVWVAVSLLFNGVVYLYLGPTEALEFFTGYLLEKALSVDNIFVFAVIFTYFAVPRQHQHRVLFWGIVGAVVMRLTFILAGAALLEAFHWIIYVFGALVVVTGIKLYSHRNHEMDVGRNPVLRFARRYLAVTPDYVGQRFFVRQEGKILVTPMFLVLCVIEATDVVFAVDSIPAIFAITHNPFIVFTSNIFAVLGLRALYFLLSGVMSMFRYLNDGLAAILCFIGVKMLLTDVYKIPISISLGVICLILTISIVASIYAAKSQENAALSARVKLTANSGDSE